MTNEYIEIGLGRSPRCRCGKVCFDKKGAQTKKNFLERIGNERSLRIYKCNKSNWWHMTKTNIIKNDDE